MESVNTPQLDTLARTIQEKLSAGLTSVFQNPVNLQLGHLGLVPLCEIEKFTGQGSMTSIYIPLLGDVMGDIFLFMGNMEAAAMADLMMGNPAGTTSQIREYEASALKELGNITSGVIITEMANTLQLSMMLTTPNYSSDFATAVVDQVLISYAENGSDAYAMHIPFNVEGHLISGFFLILFDKMSLDLILSRMVQAGQGGAGA